MENKLNLSIDLNKLTAGQLAHLYLVVSKMGRMGDAQEIMQAITENCGACEANSTILSIDTVAC